MNWGQTKTIFIICFLLLDVFLGYKLWQDRHEYHEMYETEGERNLDQLIENKDIDTTGITMPDADQEVTFLEGTPVDFNGEEIKKALNKLSGSNKKNPVFSYTLNDDGTQLQATFTKPLALSSEPSAVEINNFLSKYVYKGNEYQYWSSEKTDEMTVYHFVLSYDGHLVFSIPKNDISTLSVQVRDGKIMGYEQTYMHLEGSEKKMPMTVKPKEALQNLWSQNYLLTSRHPKIVAFYLCYINMNQDIDEQTTANYIPAWYIKVKFDDGEKEYFVSDLNIQEIDDKETEE